MPITGIWLNKIASYECRDFVLLVMSSCLGDLNSESLMMLYGYDGLLAHVYPNFYEVLNSDDYHLHSARILTSSLGGIFSIFRLSSIPLHQRHHIPKSGNVFCYFAILKTF